MWALNNTLVVAARGTDEAVWPAHVPEPGGAGVIVREQTLEGEEGYWGEVSSEGSGHANE